MSIVRAPREQDRWTRVKNETIEDPRLSFKALGLLVYILSKPDHWRVSREHLASTHTDGQSAVGSALQELRAAGYLVVEKIRGDDGRMSGTRSVIYDTPQVEASPTPPETEGRENERWETERRVSARVVSTEVARPEEATTERDASSPSDAAASPAQLSLVAEDSGPTAAEIAEQRFEEHFWPVYPRRHGRRANKAQALATWRRLSVADQRAAVRGVKVYARFCELTDTYAKDPDRWLRDRKWEEQDPAAVPTSGPPVVSSAPALGLPNGGKVTMSPEAVAAMWQQVDSGLDGTEQPAGTRGPLRSPGHR